MNAIYDVNNDVLTEKLKLNRNIYGKSSCVYGGNSNNGTKNRKQMLLRFSILDVTVSIQHVGELRTLIIMLNEEKSCMNS